MAAGGSCYTISQIAVSVGFSSGSVLEILTKHICQSYVHGVSKRLTKKQNAQRMKCCKHLLKVYKNADKRRLKELLTGEEKRIYYFESQGRVHKNSGRSRTTDYSKTNSKFLIQVSYSQFSSVLKALSCEYPCTWQICTRDRVLESVRKSLRNP